MGRGQQQRLGVPAQLRPPTPPRQILWRQFLKFKETELPAREADKNRSKVIFQALEVPAKGWGGAWRCGPEGWVRVPGDLDPKGWGASGGSVWVPRG